VFSPGTASGFLLVLFQLRFRVPATVTHRTQLIARRMAVLPLPGVVIDASHGHIRAGIPIRIVAHSRIVSRVRPPEKHPA
jgi:hypothetical protein